MTVKELSSKHIANVVGIAKLCFGSDYLTSIHALNYLHSNCNSFVVTINNSIVGFALLKIEDINTISPEIKNNLNSEQTIGTIQTIAIMPKYQGKGIGSELLKQCINYLSKKHCESVFFPSWVENKNEYFLNTLNKLGFKPVKVYENFWYNDSIAENFNCIRCGSPPCSCSLNLFKL